MSRATGILPASIRAVRCFEGNTELRERLQDTRTVGALGDNYETKIVIDTPEHRKALEDAGLRPWSEAVIDDRLWKEAVNG